MTNFIQPYNPEWKSEFERLRSLLTVALKDFPIYIQHVGSTSIPGLYAKPILDIDIIITNEIHLAGISAVLDRLGYINRGEQGIPGRFAFRQSSNLTPFAGEIKQWQEHHLYVCFSDSLALKNHLLFRDRLMNDDTLMAKYSGLKKSLVENPNMNREEYTKRKTDFIISVLATEGFSENELAQIVAANS